MNNYYIRFGEIPKDEKSGIYRGEELIGKEHGVSVYYAIFTPKGVALGLSLPVTGTTLDTQQSLLRYDSRKCYLVTGDCVGVGADGEPLLKNIKVIKEINYRKEIAE